MQPTPLARRALDRPEARFLVAGGIAALVNWLVRFPVELVLPYFAALLVATCIGMTCGFLLYRAWVFPGSTRPLSRQVRDFILVNLTGQATMLGVAALSATAADLGWGRGCSLPAPRRTRSASPSAPSSTTWATGT